MARPPRPRQPHSLWYRRSPSTRQPGHLAALCVEQGDRQWPHAGEERHLKVYNWVAYINQKDLDAFGKKYGCKVELTTFNTMTEAISKLRGQPGSTVRLRPHR